MKLYTQIRDIAHFKHGM